MNILMLKIQHLGYYASKKIDGGRFKIDIKPAVLKSLIGEDNLNILSFDFSYYFENVDDKFDTSSNLEILHRESESIIKNF